MAEQSIILFDGVCNLCNGFVRFVLPRDRKEAFLFGSLQSVRVREMLRNYSYSSDSLSTVVLLEQNQLYTRSTAVLRIARKLGGGWPLFYGFIIIPRFLRDGLYDLLARNRYRLFGQREICMVPTPEWKARFI
ncbi:MAG: DCC1-like thiol-disulfide oxidoreductase family protein [Cytophagales bacterium]|nr:DCC1-like thiol-disulfide oxidoreductase family protein [Cytophagales bacterium]